MATDVASTLKEQFTAHKEEMVVVVSREYRFHGCTGFGHEPQLHEYRLDIDFQLGIIAELGIETAPDCVIIHTTGNHFFWNSYSRKWMEIKGEILIPDHKFSDLQKPVYAPDEEFERQQRENERRGFKDADYAMEIIIGNSEVEKYLQDRTYMEMDEYSRTSEGLVAFYRKRSMRCLPPAMLAEALEVSGITEKRRIVARELLKQQQQILRGLLHIEMLQRYAGTYMATEGVRFLFEKQKVLAEEAIDKKVHMLGPFEMDEDLYLGESTRNIDIMGVKIVVNPSTFITTLAKRHYIPIPEENS